MSEKKQTQIDKDSFKESDLLIPTYSESEQLSVSDLDNLYPAWRLEYPDEVKDPELFLFDFVRTREERRVGAINGSVYRPAEGLEKAIFQIPSEVGIHFQAHGIAGKRGSSSTELDTLLKEGIDSHRTFYTAALQYSPEAAGAIGADMPFPEGGLVVVSGKDEYIRKTDDIKYIIVGEQYLPCFDVMQNRYAGNGVKLIPWHDAPQFFCDLVNEEIGSNFSPKKIDYATTYEIGQNDNLPSPANNAGSTSVITNAVIDPYDTDYDKDEVW